MAKKQQSTELARPHVMGQVACIRSAASRGTLTVVERNTPSKTTIALVQRGVLPSDFLAEFVIQDEFGLIEIHSTMEGAQRRLSRVLAPAL